MEPLEGDTDTKVESKMKEKLKSSLEYNVLICDSDSGKPIMFNIFSNPKFRNDVIIVLKKGKDFKETKKEFNAICINEFLSRYEYEISVSQYNFKGCSYRVDAYEQIKANMDMIITYLLNWADNQEHDFD